MGRDMTRVNKQCWENNDRFPRLPSTDHIVSQSVGHGMVVAEWQLGATASGERCFVGVTLTGDNEFSKQKKSRSNESYNSFFCHCHCDLW